MFLTELFNSPRVIDELAPHFVNKQVNQKEWTKKGSGATASVWEHFSDPNTVVKLVGGGSYNSGKHERALTLAFVHFCVDHGWRSKHLPVIHGINVDDNEVLQIRMEKLVPLPATVGFDGDEISWVLSDLPYKLTDKQYLRQLDKEIQEDGYLEDNKVEDLVAVVQLLKQAAPIYAKAHKVEGGIDIDLHSGNWLMRPSDGTIIAADPWYFE